MTTYIQLLDYKNRSSNGGFPVIQGGASDINEVADINQISSFSFEFDSDIEADEFISKFPKSLKLQKGTMNDLSAGTIKIHIGKGFNCFWTNAVTGEKNESAWKARETMIKVLKSIS